MSKKIILLAVLLCCLAGLMLFVVACNEEESTNPDDNQNVASTSYIIQYTDNTGTYKIEVTPGVPKRKVMNLLGYTMRKQAVLSMSTHRERPFRRLQTIKT